MYLVITEYEYNTDIDVSQDKFKTLAEARKEAISHRNALGDKTWYTIVKVCEEGVI